MNRTGVLLVNLGTPNSPNEKDVYKYLIEFLLDERVIDYSWLKRQALVRGVIVPSRYKQSAELYRHIWTKEGSPLLVHGKNLQKGLQVALGDAFIVELAMRYQNPSIKAGLEKLQKAHVNKIVIFPLFPQYSSATTGSVHQKVMECIQSWEVIPALHFFNQFHDHPSFINAICENAKKHSIADYDHILFSFHGLPERQIQKADLTKNCLKKGCCQSKTKANKFCYKSQCISTAQRIVEELNIDKNHFTICFQSRLGKDPWLQPYTQDEINNCAKKGWKKILVFSPSFVCDCLETTCEISYEYGKEFRNLGGEKLQLVEGLNSEPAWIQGLKEIILNH